MAGHSHWANIKHKKAANDAKRGKMWSKLVKAIMVAAKHGGGDPNANIALRFAVIEAKAANVPKDTIERAIKKGSGELGADTYENIRYEGYGPCGVAVIADVLTDNRTRTAAEMRTIFGKHGGNLGSTGCVGFMFDHKGVIAIEDGNAPEDRVMEIALESGAEDVQHEDGAWIVTTPPGAFVAVKDAFDNAGVETASSELTFVPSNTVSVAGADAERIEKLIEALEDNDDVQKVYTNHETAE